MIIIIIIIVIIIIIIIIPDVSNECNPYIIRRLVTGN